MIKGLHRILRNIQGSKVGTVDTPFRLLYTVNSNSSILENKMHTEAVCFFILVLPIMGTKCPHKYSNTSKFTLYEYCLGPHDETYKSYRMIENVKMQKVLSDA